MMQKTENYVVAKGSQTSEQHNIYFLFIRDGLLVFSEGTMLHMDCFGI